MTTPPGRVVRAFLPGAQRSRCCGAATARAHRPARASAGGLFAGRRRPSRPLSAAHRLAGRRAGDRGSLFLRPAARRLDLHLFAEGRHYELAEVLGANAMTIDGVRGVRFAVWAPNARRVSVVGDFNTLGRAAPPDAPAPRRRRLGAVRAAPRPGARYKYEIVGAGGVRLPQKADPVARQTELPPATASVVAAPSRSTGATSAGWRARAARRRRDAPISIYEVHPGSWLRTAQTATAATLGRRDRPADPLRRRHGLHPCRAAADHGASVRRLLGLPAARPVRADRALRPARGFARFVDALPCGRHRRHPRLGAGAFPDRCARPRPLRRHRALRA